MQLGVLHATGLCAPQSPRRPTIFPAQALIKKDLVDHIGLHAEVVNRTPGESMEISSITKRRLDLVGQHDTKGALQAQKTLLEDGRFTIAHLALAVILTFIVAYLFF